MIGALYPLVRPILFRMDAERAHELTLSTLAAAPRLLGWFAGNKRPDASLARTVAGLPLAGPVGLAAGLDKNGVAAEFWPALGFGFIELGTVTAHAQPGNEKPRMFRIPADRAIINRMGFNNHGSAALAARLTALREADRWPAVPVGANLGKSKKTPLDEAADDYALSTERLAGVADYLTVNVSSPNTPGLRELQGADHLAGILHRVIAGAQDKPVFLKLSPDLGQDALVAAIELARSAGAAGIIATNTTITRDRLTRDPGESGGLSGRPLAPLSRSVIGAALQAAGDLPVIGVGGLETAAQVDDLLGAGCAAVQIYSALIYEGPGLPHRINSGLRRSAT